MIPALSRMTVIVLMLSSLVFGLACTSSGGGGTEPEAAAQASAAPGELVVANAWIDPSDDGSGGSAYFVLQNRGQTSRTLIAARSTRCEHVSIRRVVIDEGMVSSTELPSLDVPAGGAVAFVARGLFLQLDCADRLDDEEAVPITLELTGGGRVSFEAEQRTP